MHRQRFLEGPMGDEFEISQCEDCGGAYASGIPTQAEMDRYYAEQSKYVYESDNGLESPWDFQRFELTVEQVLPYLTSKGARILDIGCATGGLLSVFSRHGFVNVIGVDPSPQCGAIAKKIYNIEVRTGSFRDLQGWNDKFDLILMLGVLEHINDVKDAVRIASRMLKENGFIYCAVPDVEGLADCSNAPYQQFSVEHVNFFSAHSLRRLMNECDMVPVMQRQCIIEWRKGVFEPIVSGLFCRGAIYPTAFDTTTGPALKRYLAFSQKGEERILVTIEQLLLSDRPILVWGAGTLARRLLATTGFAKASITAFVDANPHLQGKTLANHPIISPRDVSGRNEVILVCSVSFVSEIVDAIRNQYHITNEIISIDGALI